MANQVVTVSRQVGSRGSYIAAKVASMLGWRYVDREIIRRAALQAQIPETALGGESADSHAVKATVAQLVGAIQSLPPVPAIASATLRESYRSDESIATLVQEGNLTRLEATRRVMLRTLRNEDGPIPSLGIVRRLVLDLAGIGNVVLVGRGAQVILQASSSAYHVRVHAPESCRVEQLGQRMGIEAQLAKRLVRESDRARAHLLMNCHQKAWDNVDLYHLVINTARVNVETAAQLIVSMVQRPLL